MQETFIYVMKNKMKENVSFKYYIYLVAKSRAYNYIKSERRKSEIIDTYLKDQNEYIEKDILELITKQETKKEIIEAIKDKDIESFKNEREKIEEIYIVDEKYNELKRKYENETQNYPAFINKYISIEDEEEWKRVKRFLWELGVK